MNLEIACLSSPVYKCCALRFGFWGTLGISLDRQVIVLLVPPDTERHRTNARLITWRLVSQNLPFWAPCIDQASSYLEGAEQAPLQAFTKQLGPAIDNTIDKKTSYEL